MRFSIRDLMWATVVVAMGVLTTEHIATDARSSDTDLSNEDLRTLGIHVARDSDGRIRKARFGPGQFNEAVAVRLLNIESLQSLSLRGVELTDSASKKIASLPELAVLDLQQAKIAVAAMRSLSKSPRLTELDLARSTLDDDGVMALKHFKGLKTVDVSECNVSGSALRSLSNERPQLDIRHAYRIKLYEKDLRLAIELPTATLFLENVPVDKEFRHECTVRVSGAGSQIVKVKMPRLGLCQTNENGSILFRYGDRSFRLTHDNQLVVRDKAYSMGIDGRRTYELMSNGDLKELDWAIRWSREKGWSKKEPATGSRRTSASTDNPTIVRQAWVESAILDGKLVAHFNLYVPGPKALGWQMRDDLGFTILYASEPTGMVDSVELLDLGGGVTSLPTKRTRRTGRPVRDYDFLTVALKYQQGIIKANVIPSLELHDYGTKLRILVPQKAQPKEFDSKDLTLPRERSNIHIKADGTFRIERPKN
jgi:hypothetical protein